MADAKTTGEAAIPKAPELTGEGEVLPPPSVRVGPLRSFVMADIPGLIEGAAEGAGLGHQFLRHLARTRLLLHVVDMAPPDPDEDPVRAVRAIEAELGRFSPELARRKADLLPPKDREARARAVVDALGWEGPWFVVSAATGEGTRALVEQAMARLEALGPGAAGGGDPAPAAPGEADDGAG